MDIQKPLLKCEELEAFCSSRRLNSARAQRVSKLRLAEPKMPFLWLILFLLLLVGCRSSDVFSYVSKSDTTITTISKYDSIIYRDSIYIYDRDTIKYVYKQRDNYHVKHYHDTIYKIYHDTIYATNIQNNDYISSHDRADHSLFWIFWILFVLLVILLFIYKKFK